MAVVSIEQLSEYVNNVTQRNAETVELLDQSASIIRAVHEETGLPVAEELFSETGKHAQAFNDINVKLTNKLANDLQATEEYARLINKVDVSLESQSNADENTAGVDTEALLSSI